MKKRIIVIAILLLVLLLGVFGGWMLKTRDVKNQSGAAEDMSNMFLTYLSESKKDEAYQLTSIDYRTAVSKDVFDKNVASLSDPSLKDGLGIAYSNGNSYMFIQAYLDKEGNTTKTVTITLSKSGKDLVITSISVS